MTKIGFIGLGTMGGSFARNVRKAGFDLMVHDLHRQYAEPHLAAGATWADSPRQLAATCGVVLTSLPGPPEVTAVAGELGEGLKAGSVVFDLSTNSPTVVRQLHADYVARNHDHPSAQGLGIHDEDPKLPGATPEGAKAGAAATIASRLLDPAASLDNWMATLYHRLPLLDPQLKRVGYGQTPHPQHGWITVLDVGSGKSR